MKDKEDDKEYSIPCKFLVGFIKIVDVIDWKGLNHRGQGALLNNIMNIK